MDLPINVNVKCTLDVCGRSEALVINPITEKVTHIVVAEKDYPHIQRMVPITEILETTPDSIRLRCSPEELSKMALFQETDFIHSGFLESSLPYSVPYLVWPYSLYEIGPIQVDYEHIPANEIAIHRGTPVFAKDGKVGQVDEFLIDPKKSHITHLILREGHLWGKKDVTIPISEISKIDEDAVYLKLETKAIEKLPAIPVSRRWK